MFAGLIVQQWQGILRWFLTSAGTAAVAAGYITSNQATHATDIVIQIVGGLVTLGSMAWTIHSNQAKVIKTTAKKI